LFNLGNDTARLWLTDHISGLIAKEGIDLYRQDFNMDPLPTGGAADAADRQGITEIRHVQGYLAYWDELPPTPSRAADRQLRVRRAPQ